MLILDLDFILVLMYLSLVAISRLIVVHHGRGSRD